MSAASSPSGRRVAQWTSFALAASLLGQLGAAQSGDAVAAERQRALRPMDVFELELAQDPQISPDGRWVVYERTFMDVMADRRRSNLWLVATDGSSHRPLTTGLRNDSSPRWSPQGDRIVYVSSAEDGAQLHQLWLDTGATARMTQLRRSPGGVTFSRDGHWLAFTQLVPEPREPFTEMPAAPRGAQWADPPKVIDRLQYRADGAGYLEDGYRQLFVLSTEGGTPRQVTSGEHHVGAVDWTPEGTLVFSSNRREDWRHEPNDSELWEVDPQTGELRQLTDRRGPDQGPRVSPDGRAVAFVGYDDRYLGNQNAVLSVLDRESGRVRHLTGDLDRGVQGFAWMGSGEGLVVQYDDLGRTALALQPLRGSGRRTLVEDLGGGSLGRPYTSGSFSLSASGRIAYTRGGPHRPSDVGLVEGTGGNAQWLTRLNDDLLAHKELGEVEEIWVESSYDGRRIQAWVVTPPGFDPSASHPLILEIHGGPFAAYGPHFAAEIQLYAAAGYVVVYANPRGSTSYGQEFANQIHHAYPGRDYDDLMSVVDAVAARPSVDAERLFVTGGSGGGVLTSWIVGHTDRFAAAVVAKPVINWTSFVLTADNPAFFYRYWFPGPPWEVPEEYRRRSPLFAVGNVSTPTMLLTGEEDYRTPMSESEQYYQALKLREVDSVLVRIPGASHGIANRPSQLMAKVLYILEWFERYDPARGAAASP